MSHPHHTDTVTEPDIVEAVQLLWQLMTPVVDIARRLKLDQATVLHVIKHGALPARQLTLFKTSDTLLHPTEQNQ